MNIFFEQSFRAVAPFWDHHLLVSNSRSNRVDLVNKRGHVIESSYLSQNFSQPEGMVYDGSSGNTFVVDRYNGCVKVFSDMSDFEFEFGNGILNEPVGIALEKNRIYVADNENHRVAVFDKQGNLVDSIGSGFGHGYGQLFCPCGVAVYKGLVIVAEWGNGRVQFFKNGKSVFVQDGFPHAHDVKVDAEGRVYVAVYTAKQVRSFKIGEITEDLVVAELESDQVYQLEVSPIGLVFGDGTSKPPWVVTKSVVIKGVFGA